MRFITFIIAATLMLGCSYQPRTSIPDNEKTYRATFTTTKTRKQAFDDVEVELVRVFNDAKAVTQVNRPENGRIVGKALSNDVIIRVIDPLNKIYGNVPYVIDFQANDNLVSFSFEVIAPARVRLEHHYIGPEYPTDMIPVLNEFKDTAESLAKAVGGVLKEETEIPKPAPPKEQQRSINRGKAFDPWNP
jgi:hypothetical protein